MIPRLAVSTLQRLARGFPVIALTAPRQSGKTTLAKAVFVDKTYVSLENPDEREFAERDPRWFFLRFDIGAILDEVRRCPKGWSMSAGRSADLYFWRGNVGHEADVLYETAQGLQAVEIKSGSTFASDWPVAAQKWQKFAGDEALAPVIVFGGTGDYVRESCRVVGWRELRDFLYPPPQDF